MRWAMLTFSVKTLLHTQIHRQLRYSACKEAVPLLPVQLFPSLVTATAATSVPAFILVCRAVLSQLMHPAVYRPSRAGALIVHRLFW